MRVLLVEDYPPLLKSITTALREAGYTVDATPDGAEGLVFAERGVHDVAVLDIMLPGVDGMTILRCIRSLRLATRVLMLTARDTLSDRVSGLDAGADDYMVKPFALQELLARVRSLMRRTFERADTVVRVGDLEFDALARQVRRAGVAIALTAREYGVLEALARRPGHIVTREEITERVYEFASDPGSNVVDVYVGYVRRKLELDGGARLIHTRRGLGYVLAERDPS